MRRALFQGLVLAALAASGCQTAVGNYFGNRLRDFGEIACVEVGGGLGLGGGVKAAGLLHYGVGGGQSPSKLTLGWEYGHGCAFGAQTGPGERGLRTAVWLPHPWSFGEFMGIASHLDGIRGYRGSGHPKSEGCLCVSVLPAIWSSGDSDWSRIHKFDVEATVFAGVVCVRVGFSPGEFLDFVLGWFGVDIAHDDQPRPHLWDDVERRLQKTGRWHEDDFSHERGWSGRDRRRDRRPR